MSSQTFPTQLISDREVVRFDVWFFESTTRSCPTCFYVCKQHIKKQKKTTAHSSGRVHSITRSILR